MAAYVLRRILLVLPTILGITVVVFAVSRIAPGDPTIQAVAPGEQTNPQGSADIHTLRKELYGLNKPVPVQYVHWLGHVVRLNFGDSIKHRRPVISLIAERLPVTLALSFISFLIIYAVSIPTGIMAAARQGEFFDKFSSMVLLILWSLPIMWVGRMLIGYFAGPTFKSWFPPAGLSSSNADQLPFIPWLADRLWHLILPVFCLTYTGFAYLAKQVRSAVLENLRMDYVRAARAKGLTSTAVLTRHVLPNSLIPLITIAATLMPALFAGSVIVEKIFSIPGMGLLMFEAVANRDYNVVMAVVTIAGALNSLGLLLADLTYAVVDPRVDFQNVL